MNKLAKIGLGTVQFGLPYGISNTAGQTAQEEAARILNLARERDIRYIDTASVYGNAECILGLHDLRKYSVISKYLPVAKAGKIETQLMRSLSDLNITSLYGYLAHRPQDLLANPEQWQTLQRLKAGGQIEKIGYSLNQPQEFEELLSIGLEPDLIQVPYNYFDNRFKDLMIKAKERGCEIHTRSTFLQGLFFMDTDELPDFFASVKPIIQDLQLQYKEQLSGILLKYALDAPFIDVVIIGVENRQQLKENIKSLKVQGSLDYRLPKIDDQILMPSCWPTK